MSEANALEPIRDCKDFPVWQKSEDAEAVAAYPNHESLATSHDA
jgi:hypothetical protein